MHRRLLAAAILLLLLLSFAPRAAAAAGDARRQTPQGTVSLLWNAAKRGDVATITALRAGQIDLAQMVQAETARLPAGEDYFIDIYDTVVDGDKAQVGVWLTFGNVYRFDLVREGSDWAVASLAAETLGTITAARLDLEVQPDAKQLRGRLNLTVADFPARLTALALPIAAPLNVTAVRVDGRDATFVRYPDHDFLTITMPGTGGAAQIAVEYGGTLSVTDPFSSRRIAEVGPTGSWLNLPLGLGAAKAADVYVTVPAGQTAVLGGKLIDQTTAADGRQVYHYREDAGFSGLAVGNYRAVETSVGGVTARLNLLDSSAAQEQQVTTAVREAVAFYTDHLGRYPLPGLTVSLLPQADGGAETGPGHVMVVPAVTPPSEATNWNNFLAREVAKQWVGQLAASSHPWCTSALAVYLADLSTRSVEGPDAFQSLIDYHQARYQLARRAVKVGAEGGQQLAVVELPLIQAVNPAAQADFYLLNHHKGALVYNVIRTIIGDTAFWDVTRQFLSRYAGRTAQPTDYLAVVKEVTGQDLTELVAPLMRTSDGVALGIGDLRRVRTAGTAVTMVTITNRGGVIAPFVDILIEGGPTPGIKRVALTDAPTTVQLPGRVDRVTIDPEQGWLDLTPGDNWVGTGILDRGSPTRAILIRILTLLIPLAIITIGIVVARRLGWRRFREELQSSLGDSGPEMQQGVEGFDPDQVAWFANDGLPAAEQVEVDNRAKWHDGIESILASDVGSTTTKAILWRRNPAREFELVARAEAPTTVEAPWENVTYGVTEAVTKIERATGISILAGGRIVSPPSDGVGVSLYISSSSAGGGLQMVVAGIAKTMTADSAERAAAAAGGIVTEVLAIDDGKTVIDRVRRLRQLRPDIILLCGGTDGGEIAHVMHLAEQIAIAEPRTRYGHARTPLVYAGNAAARPQVVRLLGETTSLHIVPNIRPVLERENLEPAREMVHRLFMEHVMSQAPGYADLMAWADNALLPTPGAVGRAMEAFGRKYGINVIGLDIGGATTDVFSLVDGRFRRTVSANLGMSYSAPNVLAKAGQDAVARWLPFTLADGDLADWAANKMVRPTTLPQTMRDLQIEQAIAREALRLSLTQHCDHLRDLHGVQRRRGFGDIFSQGGVTTTVDMLRIDAIIGSGGVLSHAPSRAQSLLMLLDSMQPEGVTEIFVDRIFMSPQLGLLSTFNGDVAAAILERDGLELLATCIAPAGRPAPGGTRLARVVLHTGNETLEAAVIAGDLSRIEIPTGVRVTVQIHPHPEYDCGAGPGEVVDIELEPGTFGLILDGRGRPITLPEEPRRRSSQVRAWYQAVRGDER